MQLKNIRIKALLDPLIPYFHQAFPLVEKLALTSSRH